MIKVLWCRFQQCFGTFTILLVEASSEMGLFRHRSVYVFVFRNLENKKCRRVIFFFKMFLKFNLDFKKAAKNWEKLFCSWDNWICIGIVKMSLLRIGYFYLAANVLTSRPKIWHANKRHFFNYNLPASEQWIW